MNNFEAKNFFDAVKVFVTSRQNNNGSIKKKSVLDFECKILAALECYKLHANDINTFVNQKEEEKAFCSGDSGIEDNEEDKTSLVSSKDLEQMSDEFYLQAVNDYKCAKYLKNRGSEFASQAVLMCQQAAEKTMKAYWLQNPTNVNNLLKLRKISKPGKETVYYHSHDLVLLAKGLSIKEGKIYFLNCNTVNFFNN